MGWNANSQRNLSFSTPHFIGYRIYDISRFMDGVGEPQRIDLQPGSYKSFKLKDINTDEIRKSYYNDK